MKYWKQDIIGIVPGCTCSDWDNGNNPWDYQWTTDFGCTDPAACNYEVYFIWDDGTCVYPEAAHLDCDGNDCADVSGGNSVVDSCGTCDDDASNDCVQDCADEWGGTAWVSDCGCVPAGNSGDECDDCAGVPYGTSWESDCGCVPAGKLR